MKLIQDIDIAQEIFLFESNASVHAMSLIARGTYSYICVHRL